MQNHIKSQYAWFDLYEGSVWFSGKLHAGGLTVWQLAFFKGMGAAVISTIGLQELLSQLALNYASDIGASCAIASLGSSLATHAKLKGRCFGEKCVHALRTPECV